MCEPGRNTDQPISKHRGDTPLRFLHVTGGVTPNRVSGFGVLSCDIFCLLQVPPPFSSPAWQVQNADVRHSFNVVVVLTKDMDGHGASNSMTEPFFTWSMTRFLLSPVGISAHDSHVSTTHRAWLVP